MSTLVAGQTGWPRHPAGHGEHLRCVCLEQAPTFGVAIMPQNTLKVEEFPYWGLR